MQSDVRTPVSLRIVPGDLALIDEQADRYKLSRTEYMVRCALGRLVDEASIAARIEDHEERLARMEAATF